MEHLGEWEKCINCKNEEKVEYEKPCRECDPRNNAEGYEPKEEINKE